MVPAALLFLPWKRYLIYGLVVVAIMGTFGMWCYMKGKQALYEYKAEQAEAAVELRAAREVVTKEVVVKYVQVKGKTEVVTRTIEKEVEVYVESNPTGHCLDPDWGRVHDQSAANAVPDAGSAPDGEGRAPTAAEALKAVTGNYAACHRTADRLDALQDWVRKQEAVSP